MEKKYTARALRTAVRRYFDSISREAQVTEKLDTGEKDSWGHAIYELVPVKNKLGQLMTVTEYLVPPTVGGLCQQLRIHPSTWSRWCDEGKYPEFADVVAEVKNRMVTWRQEQVVTRDKVAGLIWDLEVNHGAGREAQEEQEQRHGVLLLPAVVPLPVPPEEGEAGHG